MKLRVDTSFVSDLRIRTEQAAEEAANAVAARAGDDAKELYAWHRPGVYVVEYGADLWEWTVTGFAASTITAYVVPDKKVFVGAGPVTTSYINGIPLNHPSFADEAVTETHSKKDGVFTIVITASAEYFSYIQLFEFRTTGETVTALTFQLYEEEYLKIIGDILAAKIPER